MKAVLGAFNETLNYRIQGLEGTSRNYLIQPLLTQICQDQVTHEHVKAGFKSPEKTP